MENENENAVISVAELNKSLKQSPDQFLLIDVLPREDFAARHIPGAINIPVDELQNHLSEIPKNKNVVVVCKMGLLKSDKAVALLHESGFSNAKKLVGGKEAWFASIDKE